jgi:hypothetical protein
MKRIITILISIFVFFIFLVYSGIFRDYNDPIDVTKYYFECLKNREGFLTYRISKSDFFNEDRMGKLYNKFNMHNLSKIQLNLKENKNGYATVQTKIIYKTGDLTCLIVDLEKKGNIWLIDNIIPEES